MAWCNSFRATGPWPGEKFRPSGFRKCAWPFRSNGDGGVRRGGTPGPPASPYKAVSTAAFLHFGAVGANLCVRPGHAGTWSSGRTHRCAPTGISPVAASPCRANQGGGPYISHRPPGIPVGAGALTRPHVRTCPRQGPDAAKRAPGLQGAPCGHRRQIPQRIIIHDYSDTSSAGQRPGGAEQKGV